MALDGPIDRIGLADSLYATGECATALRIYSEVDLQAEPTARPWVLLQQASCHRRLGRIDAAKDFYRQVVAGGEPPWMVGVARWWLASIDEQERLAQQSQRLRELLTQLEQEVTRELNSQPGELRTPAGTTAPADVVRTR